MADQGRHDEAFAVDMQVIDGLVENLGLQRRPGDAETILDVGDFETTRVLAGRHGLFTFETTSRGQRSTVAVFSAARDARRYMIMDLSEEAFRFHSWTEPIVMERLAPGSEVEEGPTGYRLSWPGGEATFHRRYEAATFSWVIGAEPTAIVASYQHPNGEPLFDLGIAAAVERQPGRAMDPAPIETPPPDDEKVDQATIQAVLAEVGWEDTTPSGDVLSVSGPGQVGRAIAYRHSQFIYESVVDLNYRKAIATFSSAAAARRFMIMELSSTLRMRHRLPKIQPSRLAAGCTIEKGPTGFQITWPGGAATFPIGYIGHQHALTFSWVATAELGEIAASYRHPSGEPLFHLNAA
jgi:hypothetical protein